jgi:hypothetical protein
LSSPLAPCFLLLLLHIIALILYIVLLFAATRPLYILLPIAVTLLLHRVTAHRRGAVLCSHWSIAVDAVARRRPAAVSRVPFEQ